MTIKCTACNTSVYPNDSQISLDGAVYHKPCAKCADCKCQISLSNFTKSGDTLLCKTHYFKRFHEEGSYLGGDKYARASSQDGVGGKKTVEPVNASSAASDGATRDGDKAMGTASLKSRFEKPAAATALGDPSKPPKKLPSFGSSNPKCAVCSKSIYPNDPQIALDGVKYHKECAKCEDCKCSISLANFTKSGTTLLCKTHYFARFNVTGSYLGGDKFAKKAERDGTKGSSPSAAMFADSDPTQETTNSTSTTVTAIDEPPLPADADVAAEPPAVPVEQVEAAPVATAAEEPVSVVEEEASAVSAVEEQEEQQQNEEEVTAPVPAAETEEEPVPAAETEEEPVPAAETEEEPVPAAETEEEPVPAADASPEGQVEEENTEESV